MIDLDGSSTGTRAGAADAVVVMEIDEDSAGEDCYSKENHQCIFQ